MKVKRRKCKSVCLYDKIQKVLNDTNKKDYIIMQEVILIDEQEGQWLLKDVISVYVETTLNENEGVFQLQLYLDRGLICKYKQSSIYH